MQCNRCGLVFLNPRPVGIEIALRDGGFDPNLLPKMQDDPLWRARIAEWSCLVEPFVPGRRLLDFGCGVGKFWNVAQQAGWDAFGCDISREIIAQARAFWKTDRLFAASIAGLIQTHPNSFDVINASQTFEHFADPAMMARALWKLLTPGGVLTVDVPNLNVWSEKVRHGSVLDVPAHCYYFAPGTIRRLFESNGYRVVGVWSGIAALRWLARRIQSPQRVGQIAARLRKFGGGGGLLQVVAIKSTENFA